MFSIAAMGAELAIYSLETIARRTLMMTQGTCSPAEYRKMIAEKAAAMGKASIALGRGDGGAAIKPFHKAAKANARRLRRK